MEIIQKIAAMLTEDPNVFLELVDPSGQTTPNPAGLTSQTELRQQATQDRLEKTQQDLAAKQMEQQKRVLRPQIDKLQDTVKQTKTGMQQAHQETTQDITANNTSLDVELRNIQQLLNQIDKAI